jgi:Family of unknown function (DUF6353)
MIKLNDIAKVMRRQIKDNTPLILSVAAGVGTLTTAWLAGKASFTAAEVIQNDEETKPPYANSKDQFKGRAKLVWKLYIPTAISAGCTIVCIASSNRVATKKTLAAHSALAVTQRAFGEYRNKVIDEFGARKDQTIRDDVARKRVVNNPPPEALLIVGSGNVLCCELHNDRYFMSDMESLLTAVNKLNHRLISQGMQSMNDWYDLIGLRHTSLGDEAGWTDGRLMELDVHAVLTEDNRPCLAFDYNYVRPFGKLSLLDE